MPALSASCATSSNYVQRSGLAPRAQFAGGCRANASAQLVLGTELKVRRTRYQELRTMCRVPCSTLGERVAIGRRRELQSCRPAMSTTEFSKLARLAADLYTFVE